MDRALEIPASLEAEILHQVALVEQPAHLSEQQRQVYFDQISQLVEENNAALVAHYYVDEQLQILAEKTGGCVADSLGMAAFGNHTTAETLVVIGVKFMGETSKILNPEKRILMPTLEANCSLDLGCPADEFANFCAEHPDRTVVVYANTSAAVKASADWMVTSSNALDIIRHLKERGERFIWAPDKHLGRYIQQQTGADMLRWQGSCIVHDEFKADALKTLMTQHPDAEVLVHPESPEDVVALATVVGSTTKLINAAAAAKSDTVIVATDYGIFHKMKQAAPDKILLVAPTGGTSPTCTACAHCPWMASNSLQNLATTLETGSNEILISDTIRERALLPIERMLNFSKTQGLV